MVGLSNINSTIIQKEDATPGLSSQASLARSRYGLHPTLLDTASHTESEKESSANFLLAQH